jgi:DNA-binding LacI/PurR family transcriptional regulator
MAITQRELARRTGVSRITVQRALSGHPYVDAGVRSKVLAIADEFGYDVHTNGHARALIAKRYGRRVRHGVLAVLLPRDSDVPSSSLPFFIPLLSGIEVEAERRNIDIYLCTNQSEQLPRLIREGGVDGVIHMGIPYSFIDHFKETSMPTVALTTHIESSYCLTPDVENGMRQAVKHLVELGHEKIAYIGQRLDYYGAQERLEGYRAALGQHNLPVCAELIEATLKGITFGAQGAARLVERTRDFTAIVCYNDWIAMRVIRYLEDMGQRVPHDISVVGIDDISTQHEFRPAITSVAFDRLAMGKRAVQLLSEDADDKQEETQHEVFPTELIVRDSTSKVNRRRKINLGNHDK